MTIGDLKQLAKRAVHGSLEKVNIKIDGGPLFFTCDAQTCKVFVVKDVNDFASAGVSPTEIRRRYPQGSPVEHVGEAFAGAAEALQILLSTIDKSVLFECFGAVRNNFFSIEVVYPNDQRVFGYDGKHIVFHPNPMKVVDNVSGDVFTEYVNMSALNKLMTNIVRGGCVECNGWKIHSPLVIQLRDISQSRLDDIIISEIERLQINANVDDAASIQELVAGLIQLHINEIGVHEPSGALAKNLAGIKGAPTSVQVKKLVSKSEIHLVDELITNRETIRNDTLDKLDEVFNRLAIGVMQAIDDLPLRARVQQPEKIKAAISLANSHALDGHPLQQRMKRQANRLGNPEDMVPLEGIVFLYNEQMYKFTGQFGPANQLIGMLRKLGL